METTIILTPMDAEQFKKFQKYHKMFIMLEQTGAFDVQYGKVSLNFQAGSLKSVNVENVFLA